MSKQHTLEPWAAIAVPFRDGVTHEIRLATGNHKIIAEVRGERYALLMEAAPDLLAACKDAVEFFEDSEGIAQKLLAAIAKAEADA